MRLTARLLQRPPKVLIIGGGGQLGPGLARLLRKEYGIGNVILSDVRKANNAEAKRGPYEYIDVCKYEHIERVVVNQNVDWVFNFAALLSAISEAYPDKAYDVNLGGSKNVLDVAKNHNLRVFIPSTIGAFGPSSQLTHPDGVPDIDIQKATSFYGRGFQNETDKKLLYSIYDKILKMISTLVQSAQSLRRKLGRKLFTKVRR